MFLLSTVFINFAVCIERFTIRFGGASDGFISIWGGFSSEEPCEDGYIGNLYNVNSKFIYNGNKLTVIDDCFWCSKIKISTCLEMMKNPEICRRSCLIICPKDKDFGGPDTIYISIKPYEDEEKTIVPESELPPELVRNCKYSSLCIFKSLELAIKVSRENPLKDNEEPGTSTTMERETRTSYNLRKKRKRENSSSDD